MPSIVRVPTGFHHKLRGMVDDSRSNHATVAAATAVAASAHAATIDTTAAASSAHVAVLAANPGHHRGVRDDPVDPIAGHMDITAVLPHTALRAHIS